MDGWKPKSKSSSVRWNGKCGQAGPGHEIAFAPRGSFDAQQIGEKLRIGKLLVGRGVQPVLQHRGRLIQPQPFQVDARLIERDHGCLTVASTSYAARDRC